MRVCHVSPHLPPDQAANALLPAQLGIWQASRGDVVTFVTQPPSQGRPPTAELPGMVWRVRPRSKSRVARVLRIDAAVRARSIVRALDAAAADADLLHLHSNGLIVEVAAAWAARRGIPYVLTLYGTEIWHYRRRWPVDPFRRAYLNAAAVTFYSGGLLDRARELGLQRPDLSVVYPPVSDAFVAVDNATRAAWRQAFGIREPRVILNVKRLHPLAGQDVLLEAFAGIAKERDDVRLLICGTGELREALEAQAARLGIADKVTFAGLVPNADVARYAAVADVFALPSRLEALPTVAVEALAAGSPVVSADHPGGVELNGLFGGDVAVVPREDPVALAGALRRAIEAPRRTTRATADLVRVAFSPAAIERAYGDLYRRATRRP